MKCNYPYCTCKNASTFDKSNCEAVASSCNNELVIKPEELIGDWIDKRCPKCDSQMLGNKKQDEWCSFVDCDYGCEDFNKHLAL